MKIPKRYSGNSNSYYNYLPKFAFVKKKKKQKELWEKLVLKKYRCNYLMAT